jgi:Tfp pilus assembly protein PilN
MKVRLNLATKPLESHRRFLAAAGLAAALGGIFFLTLGWHVYSVRKADAELRASTDKVRRETGELQKQRTDLERFFNLPENAKFHDRAAFLNAVIDARSFNWTRMFMDLERILPAGVHVVKIEPRQEKGRLEVKLTVGATSDEAKLKLLKALEDSPSFSHVELLDEHSPNQPGEDQTVLELTAVYSRT